MLNLSLQLSRVSPILRLSSSFLRHNLRSLNILGLLLCRFFRQRRRGRDRDFFANLFEGGRHGNILLGHLALHAREASPLINVLGDRWR